MFTAKRPSSDLRERLRNFSVEQKQDRVLQQKRKDVADKKPNKYENHKDLLCFVNENR